MELPKDIQQRLQLGAPEAQPQLPLEQQGQLGRLEYHAGVGSSLWPRNGRMISRAWPVTFDDGVTAQARFMRGVMSLEEILPKPHSPQTDGLAFNASS